MPLPMLASPITRREQHNSETQTLWEKRWQQPVEFDPKGQATEVARLARLWRSIEGLGPLKNKHVCDLGSGWGTLSRKAANAGAQVTSFDVASNALTRLPTGIIQQQGMLPQTKLNDSQYDLVIAADVLALLPERDHRLLISELHRLCKPDGTIILSTAVDIDSWNVLSRLEQLLTTDLVMDTWRLSHHAYFIRLLDLLKAPQRLAEGEERGRSRVGRAAWRLLLLAKPIWKGIAKLTAPLTTSVQRSDTISSMLERIAKRVNPEGTVSHIIVVAKCKTMFAQPKRWTKSKQE